ncbi:hypothetical protein MIT1002_03565 [Alteromonas macleodii]|nr:hypothetical protein MIT1002_03565 [Alteromonas macleodii]VTP55622.1 hypothetical protein MIT1002_03565 [Alteromonas macleodii]
MTDTVVNLMILFYHCFFLLKLIYHILNDNFLLGKIFEFI